MSTDEEYTLEDFAAEMEALRDQPGTNSNKERYRRTARAIARLPVEWIARYGVREDEDYKIDIAETTYSSNVNWLDDVRVDVTPMTAKGALALAAFAFENVLVTAHEVIEEDVTWYLPDINAFIHAEEVENEDGIWEWVATVEWADKKTE